MFYEIHFFTLVHIIIDLERAALIFVYHKYLGHELFFLYSSKDGSFAVQKHKYCSNCPKWINKAVIRLSNGR